MQTTQDTAMKTQDELEQLGLDTLTLAQFTGTGAYYRLSRTHLLTDGTKFLAEKSACFWMMDAVASHLSEIGTEDWFVLIRVQVSRGRPIMIYEDGNGGEHARQAIPYTDFALSEITLYACWDQEHWVIMLPSEY